MTENTNTYELLEGSSPKELTKAVNEKLQSGDSWLLHGSPFVNGVYPLIFCQAVVRIHR